MTSTFPTAKELLSIPRWARVFLAARAARRVQPFLLGAGPKAKQANAAIEAALAEAEAAAAEGAITPDLKQAATAVLEFQRRAPGGRSHRSCRFGGPPAQRLDGSLCEAVIAQAHSAVESLLSSSARSAEKYYRTYFAVDGKLKTLPEAFLNAVAQDLQLLQEATRRHRWTDASAIDRQAIGPLWPKGPPQPSSPARSPSPQPKLSDLKLPPEFVAFLRAGQQLKFNASKSKIGAVRLKPLSHLRIEEFTVTTTGTPLYMFDPNENNKGYYYLRAVDLIGEADRHSPEGLLAWFPDYKAFGSWDSDHHHGFIFPPVGWKAIATTPTKYLEVQWRDVYAKRTAGTFINPCKKCKFGKK